MKKQSRRWAIGLLLIATLVGIINFQTQAPAQTSFPEALTFNL